MRALVVGGTGPTGPYLIAGLQERGYDVTILHRGVHEPPGVPVVEHLHVDPHFVETLTEGLEGRFFDLVVAMYGRISAIADAVVDKCDRLISVGGMPVYRGAIDPITAHPWGMAILSAEDGPLADAAPDAPAFSRRIRKAELAVEGHGAAGHYEFAGVRFPQLYGPRNAIPWEWSVVRRVLDGRGRIIVPDNGLWIISRCAARNAAEVLLKVVDNPDSSSGQFYNCADDDQFTVRQWVELVAGAMGSQLEIVSLPSDIVPWSFREFVPPGGEPHLLVSAERAKSELGYREVVTARDALAETVAWLIEHHVTVDGYPAYTVPFDYDAEDEIIDCYRAMSAATSAQVPNVSFEVVHAMAHPRSPSLLTDEHGR